VGAATHRVGAKAAADDRGGRQDPTRLRTWRRRRLLPARGAGPHARGGAGPGRGGRQDQQDPAVTTLLDRIGITGAVITADALHAQRDHATCLAARGAHYLLIVKRNQPGLYAQLAAQPWRQIPVAFRARERGHGRTERRTLKVTAVSRGLLFLHAAAQAIQITRRRMPGRASKWSTETCYAVTSLTITQAKPAELATSIRGHWAIEGRLHTGSATTTSMKTAPRSAPPAAPRIMASRRNLAITILRLAGATCIAAALRSHARCPNCPLHTIMKC